MEWCRICQIYLINMAFRKLALLRSLGNCHNIPTDRVIACHWSEMKNVCLAKNMHWVLYLPFSDVLLPPVLSLTYTHIWRKYSTGNLSCSASWYRNVSKPTLRYRVFHEKLAMTFLVLAEPVCSLSSSHEPASSPYSKSWELSSHPHMPFLNEHFNDVITFLTFSIFPLKFCPHF
jgi:hypothetical protein